jgi:WW domain-binding protein 4
LGPREGPQEGPGGGEGGYQGDAGDAGAGPSGKRKLGEYGVRDEEDHEDWKFSHRDKKPARADPYDEDDWDPKTAFKKLKRKDGAGAGVPIKEEGQDFKREEWTGRLEFVQDAGGKGKGKDMGAGKDGLTYVPNGGGWVKEEGGHATSATSGGAGGGQSGSNGGQGDDEVKPEVEETKPDLESVVVPSGKTGASELAAHNVANDAKTVSDASAAGGGLFKKRRPPPSGRKKD